jgi:hypothetical protein
MKDTDKKEDAEESVLKDFKSARKKIQTVRKAADQILDIFEKVIKDLEE